MNTNVKGTFQLSRRSTEPVQPNRVPCLFCGQWFTVMHFEDYLSLKEWTISGMCQDCQDKAFGSCNEENCNHN